MLFKQLMVDIVREAEAGANQAKDSAWGIGYNNGFRGGYLRSGEKYAALYETALARAERAEKALKEIQEKGIDLILPYLPDGSVGSQTIIEMDRLITNILTPKTGEDE